MHPLIKFSLRLFLAVIIILFLIKPINWFCTLTGKCQPINLFYYLPKEEGSEELNFIINAKSNFDNVDFYAENSFVRTVAGKKQLVKFIIHNRSRNTIYMLPKMQIQPKEVAKYLNRYQCPCMQRQKLKPNERKILEMEFDVDIDIEKSNFLESLSGEEIKISFEI